MTKNYNPVISGRIPQGLMQQVKSECECYNWSNTELLCHVLELYFKDNVYNEIDDCIHKNKNNEYETLAKELKSFKETISRFNQSLGDYGRENIPPLFGLVIDLTAFQLKIVELLESLIQIQLKDIDVDQQRTPGNKDKNDIWEEG